MKIISKACILFAAGLCSTAVLPARADYLLTIDETDPTAVVITGTGANAANTEINYYYYGVSLGNFFTSDVGGGVSGGQDLGSTLTALQSAGFGYPVTDYVVWQPTRNDVFSYVNLWLTFPLGPDPAYYPEAFFSGLPAFGGTTTINLSGLPLPAYGAHGSIYVGSSFFPGSGVPIGEWTVIAAPPPPPPPLADPAFTLLTRISPTQFGFSINGTNGANYTVQYVTNLASTNWLTLTSFTMTTNPYPVVDTSATNTTRYYRVRKN